MVVVLSVSVSVTRARVPGPAESGGLGGSPTPLWGTGWFEIAFIIPWCFAETAW